MAGAEVGADDFLLTAIFALRVSSQRFHKSPTSLSAHITHFEEQNQT